MCVFLFPQGSFVTFSLFDNYNNNNLHSCHIYPPHYVNWFVRILGSYSQIQFCFTGFRFLSLISVILDFNVKKKPLNDWTVIYVRIYDKRKKRNNKTLTQSQKRTKEMTKVVLGKTCFSLEVGRYKRRK